MFQKMIFVGNLGKDPEMRYTPNGHAVTTMSIATNRQWKDKDEQVIKETCWFRVSVWGKQGEACNQYLKKGAAVLVEGHLRPDSTTGGPRIYTRQDGTSGASFEITAETVRFLGGRREDGDNGATPANSEAPVREAETETDSIPF